MKKLLLIWSIVLIAGLTRAEEPDRIAQLEQRIYELEQRITQLETLLATIVPKSKPQAPKELPSDIDQKIRDQAAAKFPDDNATQLYFIKRETQAWKDLQTYTAAIPEIELEKIIQQAKTKFKNDFSTQLYYINREVEAYQKLKQ